MLPLSTDLKQGKTFVVIPPFEGENLDSCHFQKQQKWADFLVFLRAKQSLFMMFVLHLLEMANVVAE